MNKTVLQGENLTMVEQDATSVSSANSIPPLKNIAHVTGAESANTCPQTDGILLEHTSPGISVLVTNARGSYKTAKAYNQYSSVIFTVMLEGSMQVAWGNENLSYSAAAAQNFSNCYSLILNRREKISQKPDQDSGAAFLQLVIDRQWLEQRCLNKEDFTEVAEIFAVHGRVSQMLANQLLHDKISCLLMTRKSNSVKSRIYQDAAVYDLLSTLLQFYSNTHASGGHSEDSAQKLIKSKESEKLTLLKEKLDTTMPENIKLDDIARDCHMSVSSLQRKFKSAFGCTVIEYLRRARLEQARQSLVRGSCSLSEAADTAGYGHMANFVTAFRRQFGVTPHACRRKSGIR